MNKEYYSDVIQKLKQQTVSGQVEPVVMNDLDLSTGKKVSDEFTKQIDLYSTDIDKFRSLNWFIDEAIKQAKSKSS